MPDMTCLPALLLLYHGPLCWDVRPPAQEARCLNLPGKGRGSQVWYQAVQTHWQDESGADIRPC